MSYKTTDEHFKLFVKEFKVWVDDFGLKGWEIDYLHESNGEGLAWINPDLVGRVVSVGLAPIWSRTKPTIYEIKKSAFHEACELLFYKMRSLAKYRYVKLYDIDEENHNLIRILEGVIFEKYKEVIKVPHKGKGKSYKSKPGHKKPVKKSMKKK